jgi:hypothetical protein
MLLSSYLKCHVFNDMQGEECVSLMKFFRDPVKENFIDLGPLFEFWFQAVVSYFSYKIHKCNLSG